MMFGPRLKTVFASRRNALFWSLGVLLTAYCTIPMADEVRQQQREDTEQSAANDNDTARIVEDRRQAFEQQQRLARTSAQ